MYQIIQRIPFLLELFFNGSFILLYSLIGLNKLPEAWNKRIIDLMLSFGANGVPVVLALVVMVNYLNSKNFEMFLRKYIFSLVVFIPLILTWGDPQFAFLLSSVHLLSSILTLYDFEPPTVQILGTRKLGLLQKIRLRPAQMILLSFVGLILLGTFFLLLPVSSAPNKSLSFIDALFLATSASCVTGLSPLSIFDDLSLFGQLVLLGLIQVGGIGIMTISTSMAVLLGKSMMVSDRIFMQELLEVSSQDQIFALIFDIIRYTLVIEIWGGIILTVAFVFDNNDISVAIYWGFFHSISAFCNAGFSIFNNSLEGFATNPLIHGTIAVLITLGGVGFVALKEIQEVLINKKTIARVTLHTKTVLVTSLLLTLGGALFIFFGEYLHALDRFSTWEKIQIALFQSITTRTAGFNSIPMASLHTYTILGIIILMFIGASPGSTGGGIKTTTLAILVQSIWSTLKSRSAVILFNRRVPDITVVRATSIAFISIVSATLATLILMKLEPEQSFLAILFESISALGTVGLSLGITPYLSFAGKLVITLLMLAGRIGPLTLVLAIGEHREEAAGRVELPSGKIMIG